MFANESAVHVLTDLAFAAHNVPDAEVAHRTTMIKVRIRIRADRELAQIAWC
jgi:hypothetical protein